MTCGNGGGREDDCSDETISISNGDNSMLEVNEEKKMSELDMMLHN